ncbi:MAG: alpha/beta fold hydrolase [Bacteroidota bacterium]
MKSQLIKNFKEQGSFVAVGDTQAFVYEKGKGEAVICFHGVPASSFLYRKVIDGLAENGFRGISFDILGLGLSDRPENYDYSWTSLGEWAYRLIKKLNVGKFHIILHDIGGPIGTEVISKLPEDVLSVTILNTLLTNLGQFKKPFPMFLYEKKFIGEMLVATSHPWVFQKLMHMRGVHRSEVFGMEEARAYVSSFMGNDGGKSFLKIMRSFEASSEKSELYIETLKSLQVPKQIIWGINDAGISLEKYGEPLKEAIGVHEIIQTEGSHFLQEDYPDIIVKHLSRLVKSKA